MKARREFLQHTKEHEWHGMTVRYSSSIPCLRTYVKFRWRSGGDFLPKGTTHAMRPYQPGGDALWFLLVPLYHKPRQHLCYVYASLSRLGFRGLPEKFFIVFEGVIGFSTAKKPTALMMHWWNGGRGGVCPIPPPLYRGHSWAVSASFANASRSISRSL